MRRADSPTVLFDATFLEHEKMTAAITAGGLRAAWLFIRSVGWSRMKLTDGLVPSAQALVLASVPHSSGVLYESVDEKQRAIDALVNAGLWHEINGGYVIHDFGHYQETRADVEQKRQSWRERKQRQRSRSPGGPGVNHGGTSAGPRPPSGTRGMADSAVQTVVISDSDSSPRDRAVSDLDHRKNGANGNAWRSSDYGELEQYHRAAAQLRDADAKTPIVLASVMRGLPEGALASALEQLEKRRQDRRQRPLVSESRYLVATLKQMREEGTYS